MSSVWRQEQAAAADSVGSFVIERAPACFRAWPAGGGRDGDEETGAAELADAAEQGRADAAEPSGPDLNELQADAFSRGFEEGRRTVELELAEERAGLRRLVESVKALRPEPANDLAVLLAETVDRLVRDIVGQVDIDRALLCKRAQMAAALIGESNAPSALRVHPRHAPYLDGVRIPVAIIADPDVEPGALVIETADGLVEDSPAIRLDRLRDALGRLGAPQ